MKFNEAFIAWLTTMDFIVENKDLRSADGDVDRARIMRDKLENIINAQLSDTEAA